MKTINAAPTWVWVMGFTLSLIENGKQKETEKGFVAEVERLGPDVKQLIKEFRVLKTERKQIARQLLDRARRCDEAIKRRVKPNRSTSSKP